MGGGRPKISWAQGRKVPKYGPGPLPVVRNPGWSRQFWANYSSVFPIEIIIIVVVTIIMFGTVFLF